MESPGLAVFGGYADFRGGHAFDLRNEARRNTGAKFMRLNSVVRVGTLLFLSAASSAIWADDRAGYNARAVDRLERLFQALDRNADGALTPEESRGDLDLGPRFDDIDINRDGIMTREELGGYLQRRYGSRPAP